MEIKVRKLALYLFKNYFILWNLKKVLERISIFLTLQLNCFIGKKKNLGEKSERWPKLNYILSVGNLNVENNMIKKVRKIK